MRAIASPSRSITLPARVQAAANQSRSIHLEVQKRRCPLQEQQLDLPGRTVAVLGHDDVSDALLVSIGVVLLVAIDKQDNVRILLERARLAQVRQLRNVWGPLFDRST